MSLQDEPTHADETDAVVIHAIPGESSRPAPIPRPTLVVCPYCGHESSNHSRCDRCKGLMDPLSRQASQNAMGPWFVRDDAIPFRPGCSYGTLRALIAKGRVTRESILRGPSTRQFWTRATSVPGVAHLLGECHACHTKVSADFARCPSCSAVFDCSTERQSLGLAPVRLLPGHSAPEEIARSMVEALRHAPAPARPEPVRFHTGEVEQSRVGVDVSVPEPVRRRGPFQKVVVAASVIFAVLIVMMLIAWFAGPPEVQGWLKSVFSGG